MSSAKAPVRQADAVVSRARAPGHRYVGLSPLPVPWDEAPAMAPVLPVSGDEDVADAAGPSGRGAKHDDRRPTASGAHPDGPGIGRRTDDFDLIGRRCRIDHDLGRDRGRKQRRWW